MLKVRQNNENHCATFCGKPVESVESVENAHSAKKEWISRIPLRYIRQGAKAPFKTKEQEKRLQNYYNHQKSLKKILTCGKIKSEKEREVKAMKGYDETTGLFKTRYYAKKYARGDEVVVKLAGGYTIMKASYYYQIWKKQK